LAADQIQIKEQKTIQTNTLDHEITNIFTQPARIIQILQQSLINKDLKTIVTLIQKRKTMLTEKKVFRILVFILSADYHT